MCGIIGIVSEEPFLVKESVKKLKLLDYRGYDSFGYYDRKKLYKKTGEIIVPKHTDKTKSIVLHTRWATHGKVLKRNAHPLMSSDKKVTIVHNGIISNHESLKKELLNKGYTFSSDTDSEVIANYFSDKIKNFSPEKACFDFIKEVKGEFAIVVMIEGDNKLYALKRDSPLILMLGENANYLTSDMYPFSDKSNQAIFFDNDEFAVVTSTNYLFYDKSGSKIQKKTNTIDFDAPDSNDSKYQHFMLKEIFDQPKAVQRILRSIDTDQKVIFDKIVNKIKSASKITFIASGTSYHASLFGVYCLHKTQINAQTLIASEFEHFIGVDDKTLVIALSQSGETMDVIGGLTYAKKKGAKIISMVNSQYSTIQRMSDYCLNIRAGKEISVAATKSFVNQIALLLSIAKRFGYKINLNSLPEEINQILSRKEEMKTIANSIYKAKDIYILGRGVTYPIAREIALKMKEISYIHAEGMMGGELKHGTIALIEDKTPVISIIPNQDYSIISNTREVKARGASVIEITNELDGKIKIKTDNEGKFGILVTIVGQLLTYYMALKKGVNIDKPRNLAKSVTVR